MITIQKKSVLKKKTNIIHRGKQTQSDDEKIATFTAGTARVLQYKHYIYVSQLFLIEVLFENL